MVLVTLAIQGVCLDGWNSRDVPCQLGHADIRTPERYYGHVERHVLAAGAVPTEEAIARVPIGRSG